MRKILLKYLMLFLLTFNASSLLQAGVIDYLSDYNLGVDYTSSSNSLYMSYQVDEHSLGRNSKQCDALEGDSTKMKCHASSSHNSGDGWGIILEKPFKRHGFWHADFGIDGSIRWLSGELSKEEQVKQTSAGLPLKTMRYDLAAFVLKPRIRFGITPSHIWPDILISLGPALQAAIGEVSINRHRKTVGVGTSSSTNPLGAYKGFLKLELVLWRFGEGAFSLFSESDWSGSGESTEFYPGEVDGMDDFRASFRSSTAGSIFGLGAKLLLDWP